MNANAWFEFFMGRDALQNYVSNVFGILITVVVVDRLIQHRTKQKIRPLREMSYVMVFEIVDGFISKNLPEVYRLNGSRTLRFGKYYASSGLYAFHKIRVAVTEIITAIEDLERKRWQAIDDSSSDDGPLEGAGNAEEDNLRSTLRDLRAYGHAIEEFISRYQGVLDLSVVQQLSNMRFEIAKAFRSYYEPLKRHHHPLLGVDLYRLLPRLVIQSIELNSYLAKSFGHAERDFSGMQTGLVYSDHARKAMSKTPF